MQEDYDNETREGEAAEAAIEQAIRRGAACGIEDTCKPSAREIRRLSDRCIEIRTYRRGHYVALQRCHRQDHHLPYWIGCRLLDTMVRIKIN